MGGSVEQPAADPDAVPGYPQVVPHHSGVVALSVLAAQQEPAASKHARSDFPQTDNRSKKHERNPAKMPDKHGQLQGEGEAANIAAGEDKLGGTGVQY